MVLFIVTREDAIEPRCDKVGAALRPVPLKSVGSKHQSYGRRPVVNMLIKRQGEQLKSLNVLHIPSI